MIAALEAEVKTLSARGEMECLVASALAKSIRKGQDLNVVERAFEALLTSPREEVRRAATMELVKQAYLLQPITVEIFRREILEEIEWQWLLWVDSKRVHPDPIDVVHVAADSLGTTIARLVANPRARHLWPRGRRPDRPKPETLTAVIARFNRPGRRGRPLKTDGAASFESALLDLFCELGVVRTNDRRSAIDAIRAFVKENRRDLDTLRAYLK